MAGAASAIRAGAAFVEIGANVAPFNSGIDQAKNKLQEFATSVKIAAGILTGFLTTVVAGATKAVDVASDMQEQQAKFDVVFKHNIENMNKWRDKFAEVMRLSRLDLTSWLAQAQDTFVPLGFAREDAESLSKLLVRLGLDLAAFNNMAPEDTQRNLISGLVGEPEALRKYGIIINDAALETELFKMGVQGGTEAASEQEKMLARLAIILRSTTDAQGQATREADGWAAAVRGLTSQLNDLMRVVGEQIIPLITPYLNLVTDAIEATKMWADANPQIVESLFQVFVTLSKLLAIVGGISALVFLFGTMPGQIFLLGFALLMVLDYLDLVDTGFKDLADNLFVFGDTISGHLEMLWLKAKLGWQNFTLIAATAFDEVLVGIEDFIADTVAAFLGPKGLLWVIAAIADELQSLGKMAGLIDDEAQKPSERWKETVDDYFIGGMDRNQQQPRQDKLDKRAEEINRTKKEILAIENRRKDPEFIKKNAGKDWMSFFNSVRNKPIGAGGEQFGNYVMPNIKPAPKESMTPKKDDVTGFFGGRNVAEMLGAGMGTFSIEKEQLNALKGIKDAITSLPQSIGDKLAGNSTPINVAGPTESLIPYGSVTPPSVPQLPSSGVQSILSPNAGAAGTIAGSTNPGIPGTPSTNDSMSKLLSTAEKIEVNTRTARTPTYR